MAANVFFNALQAIDANGDAVSGAKAYFFDTGTSNLQTVYTDSGLGTPHPSPLVADSSGVFAPVFQSGSTDIKVNMTDAVDVVLPGYPIDPVTLQATASGASLIAFAPTPRISATDVQAAIEEVDGEVEVIEADRTIENSVYTTAGTTTAYTISVTGVTAYATGDRYWVRSNATNTDACTINVESVGAKDIKKYDSAGLIQSLSAGALSIGLEYLLHYDGTQFVIISGRGGQIERFVSRQTLSSDTEVDFALVAGADEHFFAFKNVQGDVVSTISAKFSDDGKSTFENVKYQEILNGTATAKSSQIMALAKLVDATTGVSGYLTVSQLSGVEAIVETRMVSKESTTANVNSGGGYVETTSGLTDVRFVSQNAGSNLMDAGEIFYTARTYA